jgi:hypothetical protein
MPALSMVCHRTGQFRNCFDEVTKQRERERERARSAVLLTWPSRTDWYGSVPEDEVYSKTSSDLSLEYLQ